MDLESVFDGPLSSGSSGKKSGVSVTVWQAEVALRLSESPEILIVCRGHECMRGEGLQKFSG